MNKKVWIKVSIIVAVILVAVCVPLLTDLMKVSSVDINIQYPDQSPKSIIIVKEDIQKSLAHKYGNFLTYQRKLIETKEIKEYLEKQDFVDHAVVSVSLGGVLRVTINQKMIETRVYNTKGDQFYIDSQENIIKIKDQQQVARCIITTGDISERPTNKLDSTKHKDCFTAYKLAKTINQNKILRDWIEGIRKMNQQWILIPSQGDYIIVLSKDKTLWKEELEKLQYLIQYSFSKQGWVDYEKVDLSFHNQVVCSKKEKDNNSFDNKEKR